MREIKFRAWDLIGKTFIGFGSGKFTPKYLHHINPTIHTYKDGIFSLVNKFFYGRYLDLVYQQYTGLKDKNGVEIYEGDIIRQSDDSGREVMVYGGCWVLKDHFHLCDYDNEDIEVIGNIYENPELLHLVTPN